MGETHAPAGWYPDPGNSGQQRFFDGAEWTNNYAPYPAPAPAPGSQTRVSSFTPTGERTSNRILIFRVLGAFAVLIIGAVALTAITNGKTGRSSHPEAEMGQSVQDGKFEFVVDSVYESGEATLPQPRGTWVVAAMTIRNVGDEPQSFFIQNQKLLDAAGREYAADTAAAFRINSSGNSASMVLDLNPGFELSARVPFDVPEGTAPDKIEVHDSAFSGGALVKVGKSN